MATLHAPTGRRKARNDVNQCSDGLMRGVAAQPIRIDAECIATLMMPRPPAKTAATTHPIAITLGYAGGR